MPQSHVQNTTTQNIALIFAGGVGSRMGAKIPKQFLTIQDKPIIEHTIKRFHDNLQIDQIFIVMLAEYVEYTDALVHNKGYHKVKSVISGGKTGQESIYKGLREIRKHNPTSNPIILIHDGVRPYFEDDLIDRCIKCVKESGTAISGIPAYETEVLVEKDSVKDIVDRNSCWIARAPQCFYLDDILGAHEEAIRNSDYSVIDSCSMIKKYTDITPVIVETTPKNIKVTTPVDYTLMKALLNEESN